VLNHDPAYSHLAGFSAQPKMEAILPSQDLLAVEPDTSNAAHGSQQKIAANAHRSKHTKVLKKALGKVQDQDVEIFKLKEGAKDSKILTAASLANHRLLKAANKLSKRVGKYRTESAKDKDISDQLSKEANAHSKAADDLLGELNQVKTEAQLHEKQEKYEARGALSDKKHANAMSAHEAKIHSTSAALKEIAEKIKTKHASGKQVTKLLKAAEGVAAHANKAHEAPSVHALSVHAASVHAASVHDQISKARVAARTAERAIETEEEKIRRKNRENRRSNVEHARNLADHQRSLSRLQSFIRRLRNPKQGHHGDYSMSHGYGHGRGHHGGYKRQGAGYGREADYDTHFDWGYGGSRDYGVNPPGYDEATVVRREGQGEMSDPIRRHPLEEKAIRVAQELAKNSHRQLREAIEETKITQNRVVSTLRQARRAAIMRARRARMMAASKWDYAANQGGRAILKPAASDHAMTHINKAMAVIDETAPPQSEEQKAKIRAQIEEEVRRQVVTQATKLEKYHLKKPAEEKWIQGAIKRAVVTAVSHSVERNAKALQAKQVLSPENGHAYVAKKAVDAADAAAALAKARGKSNKEIRADASDAARHASEIATREVARTAAAAAATKARMLAMENGRGPIEQKVAAEIASATAVGQVVDTKSKLHYLNNIKTRDDIKERMEATLRQADEKAKKTKLHTDGGTDALLESAPPGDTTLELMLGGPAAATSVSPAGNHTNLTANATKLPHKLTFQEKKLLLEAASIKAQAAVARIKQAARAAAMAPKGKAGEQIIAGARLIAAQASRDVADARMQAITYKTGISTAPVIHEAASQAAEIVTPIATEVATQSATLQATKAALAAVKKYMRKYKKTTRQKAEMLQSAVTEHEKGLTHTMRAKVKTLVGPAVAQAIAQALEKNLAKERVSSMAKAAATKTAKIVMAGLLRTDVEKAAMAAGDKAARTSRATGASAKEVERARSDGASKVRLDAKTALDQIQGAAEREAVGAAAKATSALEARLKAAKKVDEKVAVAQVDSAINKLVNGEGMVAASDSINAAAEAMNSKGGPKPAKVATAQSDNRKQKYLDLVPEPMLLAIEELPDSVSSVPPRELRSTRGGEVSLEEVLSW